MAGLALTIAAQACAQTSADDARTTMPFDAGDGGATTDATTLAETAGDAHPEQTTTDEGDDGTDPTEASSPDLGDLPSACDGDAVFPDPDWALGDPVAAGFDLTLLEEAAEYAESEDSHCLLVLHDGELVFERYFGDVNETTPLKSWSIAKSHTAAIVGIALARGELGSIDDSIAKYLPELSDDPRAAITLRALLSMTAGVYAGVLDDMAGMFGAPDMTQKALATEAHNEPGVAWEYSNVAVQLFEPIFRSFGVRADDYAAEHLWGPIGMDAEWMTDMAGNPAMYMNVIATCRDHARFGYLLQQRGCWAGQEVIPAAWVDQMAAPSQSMNDAYGFYMWRGAGDPALDLVDSSPLDRGALHPGAPEDSFCAVGLGGQLVEVVPSLDLVIVRMGRAAVEELEGNPFPLFEIFELLDEGQQQTHDGVVQRVLAARNGGGSG